MTGRHREITKEFKQEAVRLSLENGRTVEQVAADLAGMGVAGEQMLVQALVAQPPVEALHKAVLHRLARLDVMPFDVCVFLPFQHNI